MDLVAAEPLQLVGIERFAQRLRPHQRLCDDLGALLVVPGQYLGFEVALQAGHVRGVGHFPGVVVFGRPGQLLGPRLARALFQRVERILVGAVPFAAENLDRGQRQMAVRVQIGQLALGVDGARLNRGCNVDLGRLCRRRRHQCRLCRPRAVGRDLQAALIRGDLRQPEPPLAPQHTGQLDDQMRLGRTRRGVLLGQRVEQGLVFGRVLPRQHRVARQDTVSDGIEPARVVSLRGNGHVVLPQCACDIDVDHHQYPLFGLRVLVSRRWS